MKNRIQIMIVEDEPIIASFISSTLMNNDYKPLICNTGKESLTIAASHCPDLILLDLGLPDINGLEVIREIRLWSSIPIIVISANSQEAEKVAALDSGADDYITKPFGTEELLARIRTAIRHHAALEPNASCFYSDGLSIDFEKHLVIAQGQEVHLTQIEFKIVSLLAKNSGKVLTYDAIITDIWGPYAGNNNRILRVNMANIRRKLEKNPADPQYIFTEVGIGYRMADDHLDSPQSISV